MAEIASPYEHDCSHRSNTCTPTIIMMIIVLMLNIRLGCPKFKLRHIPPCIFRYNAGRKVEVLGKN